MPPPTMMVRSGLGTGVRRLGSGARGLGQLYRGGTVGMVAGLSSRRISMSVRLGILGAGAIGNMHADMASKVGTEIVGIYDVRAERAERLAASHAGVSVAASPCNVPVVLAAVPSVRGLPITLPSLAGTMSCLLNATS